MKILQTRIVNCTDVLFYDTGEVATITKTNGTKLFLEVAGEVDISIGTDRYRNDQRFEFIRDYKLTDKKLSALNKKDKIQWGNNNWFEVFYQQKGDSNAECVMGDVAYDYDDAIELLNSYVEDPEY
jgi:hypothetical protein